MRAHFNSRAIVVLPLALVISSVYACHDARRRNPLGPDARIVARLEKVSGDSQSQIVNRVLAEPLVVRAIAADGTPVAAAAIVFSSVEGGSFQGGNRALTDAAGRASIWWIMGLMAGQQTTAATVDRPVGASPTPGLIFRANALPGLPAQLDVLVPVNHGVPAAPRIVFDLSARVQDLYGNAVPGIVIRWSSPSRGFLEVDSTLSDQAGVVSTRWTLFSPTGDNLAPGEDSVSLRIEDARLDATVSRTIHRRVGVVAADMALAGAWRAQKWEFFADSAMTRLIEDVMANGMSGTLTLSPEGGRAFAWHWRERYRWWGPSNGTDLFGQLLLKEASLIATADSGVTRLECDWGDCDGPLHGHHNFHRDGTLLVVTRPERVRYYRVAGPTPAWTRLTLER